MNSIVERNSEVPVTCRLASIYPNPFNSRTGFTFYLSHRQPYQLAVYDYIGRRVRLLANGIGQAGRHRVSIDAETMPSGVYYLRLMTPTDMDVKPLTIIK